MDTAKADADLRKIEDRVKELEGKRHVIKVSAVFDDASASKARAAFAALDNSISRDAMQRLRSSPQGSVLGALNALFSPHPVTGAPSPQQAASQGLLGKMFGPQGGGNTSVSGGGSNVIQQIVTGQNAPQKVTVTQAGGGVSDQVSRDLENAAEEQKAAADDTRAAAGQARDAAGRFASAADKAGAAADRQGAAARDLSDASSGARGMFDSLRKLFGGGGGSGGGGKAAGAFAGNLAGGIGPGILGLGIKQAGIIGGAGSLLGSLPALLAPLAALGVGGAGAGVLALGAKQLIGTKNQSGQPATQGPLYNQAQTVLTSLQSTFKGAASVLAKPLEQAFAEIPGMLKGIEPALKSVFAGAATLIQPLLTGLDSIARMVLPALGQAFRAAAPLMAPLLSGFGKLISGLLPGITTLLHSAMPAVTAFSQILGTLGKDLGGLFSALAPAIKASVQIFQPLMSVLGALFPIVGKLAAVFAQALGPVFSQFAGVIKALMPALTIIGKVLASLAGAVLGDLVSAFTAVAQLLKGIAPSLASFATALSSAFTVLENTGVFAELGDALENLAPLLATMISQLLNGLTPLLPGIVTGLSQMSTIIVTALTGGLQQLLPPLTQLALVVLQALAQSLPVVLPVLGQVFAIFTAATADAISAIVSALAGLVNAVPKPVLDTLAGLAATLLILKKTGVISLGFKVAGAAKKLFDVLTGGGKVDVASAGMQKAGDTMAEAAATMQKAADTMAGAGTEEEAAGAEQATAGTEEVAAGGLMATGLGSALTSALPALGALTLALVAYEGLKSGANILNYFKNPSGAAQALTPGGAPPGATISHVPQSAVDRANAQNAAANASPQGQGTDNLLAKGKDFQALASVLTGVNQILGEQSKAAQDATRELGLYDDSVKASGTASQASKGYAAALVSEIESAGVNATTAQADVANYTNAIAQNGISSTQAQSARQQLISDILGASGAGQQGQAALQNYTNAVQDDGAKSQAAQSARAQLIKDLENAGLSAQQAQQLVDQLTGAIQKLPDSKTIKITMDGSGLYTITGSAVAASQGKGGSGNAAGGLAAGGPITQGTTGTADDVQINVSKGEYVVKASSVAKYGTGMMDAINAGAFANGGLVGGNLTPSFVSGMYGDFQTQMTTAMVAAMRATIKASEAASAAAASAGGGNAPAAGTAGGSVEALMKQMAAARGWTGAQWNALYDVEMREAGFSLTAQNPSSGAYGLAQFINGPSEYASYGGNSGTAAGQITAMLNYIAQRYGTPAAAWAHEQAYGWYQSGGPVGGGFMPGWLAGWMPGPGAWGSWLSGLTGMMPGAPGGSAGTASGPWGGMVGNYTGVVSPAGGGFGLTRADLGLPATIPSASTSSASTGSTSAASTTSTPAPAKPAAKPVANTAQKAAIAVLENLIGGYIRNNQMGEAGQANTLLNWLGVTKYNHQLSQISFLDGQLSKALKAKNKGAASAAEHLLAGYGVHSWNPVTTAKGNEPQKAVTAKMESLMKGDITANAMTAAQQVNALLTHLGVGKYTSELSQIGHLDSLLAQYKKAKNTKSVAATEALLRTFGVQHFAQGGTVWEPVTGVGHNSGRVYQFAENGPEHVTPGAGMGGGDTSALLTRICSQLDNLTGVAAAIPRGTGEHVGAALGGAAQSASFGRRYHHGGGA